MESRNSPKNGRGENPRQREMLRKAQEAARKPAYGVLKAEPAGSFSDTLLLAGDLTTALRVIRESGLGQSVSWQLFTYSGSGHVLRQETL